MRYLIPVLCIVLYTLAAGADASAQSCRLDDEPLKQELKILANTVNQDLTDQMAFGGDMQQAIVTASNGLGQAAWDNVFIRTLALPHAQAEADRVNSAEASRVFDTIETARTDKQVGAPPGNAGTTSMSEKATIPALLAMAIERGAISQSNTATSVTLSTTPYQAFVPFTEGGDTPSLFEKRKIWRRFAISASFPIDTADTTGAGGFDSSALSALSGRYRFIGDRSVRSTNFTRLWKDRVSEHDQALVDDTADFLTKHLAGGASRLEAYQKARIAAVGGVRTVLDNRTLGTKSVESLIDAVKTALCEEVYLPMQRGEIDVTTPEKEAILIGLDRQNKLRQTARDEMAKILKEYASGGLATAGYTFYPIKNASDYSELKLIADGWFFGGPGVGVNIVFNAQLALNHDPSRAPTDQVVRNYGGNLSAEMSIDHVIGNDLSRINFALTAKLDRLETVKKTQFGAQLKVEIPLIRGFSLPISLNYVSRTETKNSSDFRVNFGVQLDGDKLSLLRGLAAL